jgi:radical SAM superfamily enzyme YgiQ (UPF0313 family)
MKAVLISTYELGRQPFGLASPAAWLRLRGGEEKCDVTCVDLSREALPEDAVRAADLIAFYVPMHTATRLAVASLPTIRDLNARAHLCFYGLYAPVNEAYLRRLGVETVLGGEFETGLVSLVARLANGKNGEQSEPVISMERLEFRLPDRRGLVALEKYAHLTLPGGERRTVGYTEASRGCKHLCRHCPIVPVYNGVFRIVSREVVLEDVRQQVAAGAQHITFGDPDFFNGTGHAMPLVEELHREFPNVTYDVTIKVEHLLKHCEYLPKLRDTGCLFVTSAVESADDAVLEKLDKGHTRADFLEAVRLLRDVHVAFQPTFVPFTPWTTLESYCELVELLREQRLIESVAPIQLAIRLLIPAGSRLLELREMESIVSSFDETALVYPWQHADPRVDQLSKELQEIVNSCEKMNFSRNRTFERIEAAAYSAAGLANPRPATSNGFSILAAPATIPHLDEPWYCCAEPTSDQLANIGQAQKNLGQADTFV